LLSKLPQQLAQFRLVQHRPHKPLRRKVGKGRMEIAESSPPSRVTLKLDFSEPFEAHNTVVFTLVPEGAATRVTWAMDGRNAFVSKLMGLFLDMDDMIGRDFEAGLANLKSLAEQ